MRKITWTLVHSLSTFCSFVNITKMSKTKRQASHEVHMRPRLPRNLRQCSSEESSSPGISLIITWFSLKVRSFLQMTQMMFTVLLHSEPFVDGTIAVFYVSTICNKAKQSFKRKSRLTIKSIKHFLNSLQFAPLKKNHMPLVNWIIASYNLRLCTVKNTFFTETHESSHFCF